MVFNLLHSNAGNKDTELLTLDLLYVHLNRFVYLFLN